MVEVAGLSGRPAGRLEVETGEGTGRESDSEVGTTGLGGGNGVVIGLDTSGGIAFGDTVDAGFMSIGIVLASVLTGAATASGLLTWGRFGLMTFFAARFSID